MSINNITSDLSIATGFDQLIKSSDLPKRNSIVDFPVDTEEEIKNLEDEIYDLGEEIEELYLYCPVMIGGYEEELMLVPESTEYNQIVEKEAKLERLKNELENKINNN